MADVVEVSAVNLARTHRQEGLEPHRTLLSMQEARVVAHNILAAIRGVPSRAFRYRERGSMATIRRNAAVEQLRQLHLDLARARS